MEYKGITNLQLTQCLSLENEAFKDVSRWALGVEAPASFLKGFLFFQRQHEMLLLSSWWIIELRSQAESGLQMCTPFIWYKEGG